MERLACLQRLSLLRAILFLEQVLLFCLFLGKASRSHFLSKRGRYEFLAGSTNGRLLSTDQITLLIPDSVVSVGGFLTHLASRYSLFHGRIQSGHEPRAECVERARSAMTSTARLISASVL